MFTQTKRAFPHILRDCCLIPLRSSILLLLLDIFSNAHDRRFGDDVQYPASDCMTGRKSESPHTGIPEHHFGLRIDTIGNDPNLPMAEVRII